MRTLSSKALFFLLVIVVQVAVGGSEVGAANSSFKYYENTEFNFSLQYPSSWITQEGVMGTKYLAFLSALENENDLFQENINIVVEDLTGIDITLKNYFELSYAQLEKIISDFSLISSESSIVANKDSETIIFSGVQGQLRLKWLQVYILNNNKAYVVTYTAEEKEFIKYLPFMISIFTSFKLK